NGIIRHFRDSRLASWLLHDVFVNAFLPVVKLYCLQNRNTEVSARRSMAMEKSVYFLDTCFFLWNVGYFMVTSMFWYNFHGRMCIGYNCLALMAEINSFFLHSRKLLQMNNFSFDHWFYKIITLLNLFTFSTCRGFSISRIIYGMLTESHRVGFIYLVTLSMSMFVMTVINLVLFWRLLKSDLLRGSKPKVKLEDKANGNHNYNHIKLN
ncbi:hypothetical protein KUTeg_010461, partial [Tegillarca granosa]